MKLNPYEEFADESLFAHRGSTPLEAGGIRVGQKVYWRDSGGLAGVVWKLLPYGHPNAIGPEGVRAAYVEKNGRMLPIALMLLTPNRPGQHHSRLMRNPDESFRMKLRSLTQDPHEIRAAVREAVRMRDPESIYEVILPAAIESGDRVLIGEVSNAYWRARGAFDTLTCDQCGVSGTKGSLHGPRVVEPGMGGVDPERIGGVFCASCLWPGWKANPGPDERMRRLERAAASGDRDARLAYAMNLLRLGEFVPLPPAPEYLSAVERAKWDARLISGMPVLVSQIDFSGPHSDTVEVHLGSPAPFLVRVYDQNVERHMDDWVDPIWDVDLIGPVPEELAGAGYGSRHGHEAPYTSTWTYAPSYSDTSVPGYDPAKWILVPRAIAEKSLAIRAQRNPGPDERMRRLERAAASGDLGAESQLIRERARSGTGDPLVARGLNLLNDPDGRPTVTRPSMGAAQRLRSGKSALLEEEDRSRSTEGRSRRVKDLGWLLRAGRSFHWPIFFVRTLPGGRCYLKVVYVDNPASVTGSRVGGDLWEVTFETIFEEDCSVLWRWVHRPIFWGSPIDWNGARGVIPEVYGDGRISERWQVDRLPGVGQTWLPIRSLPRDPKEHLVKSWASGGNYAPYVANNPGPDERLRQLERAAVDGSHEDSMRYERAMIRAGQRPEVTEMWRRLEEQSSNSVRGKAPLGNSTVITPLNLVAVLLKSMNDGNPVFDCGRYDNRPAMNVMVFAVPMSGGVVMDLAVAFSSRCTPEQFWPELSPWRAGEWDLTEDTQGRVEDWAVAPGRIILRRSTVEYLWETLNA